MFLSLPPLVRSLTNYCFVFRTQGYRQTKGLFSFAGGQCETYKEWAQLLDESTKEPYRCLVFAAGKRTKEESKPNRLGGKDSFS